MVFTLSECSRSMSFSAMCCRNHLLIIYKSPPFVWSSFLGVDGSDEKRPLFVLKNKIITEDPNFLCNSPLLFCRLPRDTKRHFSSSVHTVTMHIKLVCSYECTGCLCAESMMKTIHTFSMQALLIGCIPCCCWHYCYRSQVNQ